MEISGGRECGGWGGGGGVRSLSGKKNIALSDEVQQPKGIETQRSMLTISTSHSALLWVRKLMAALS